MDGCKNPNPKRSVSCDRTISYKTQTLKDVGDCDNPTKNPNERVDAGAPNPNTENVLGKTQNLDNP